MNESTWTFALRRRIEVKGSVAVGLSPADGRWEDDGKDTVIEELMAYSLHIGL